MWEWGVYSRVYVTKGILLINILSQNGVDRKLKALLSKGSLDKVMPEAMVINMEVSVGRLEHNPIYAHGFVDNVVFVSLWSS